MLLVSSVYSGVTGIHTGKHDQEETIIVQVRRPFHSHSIPGIIFTSLNHSPARPYLLCKQPCNSLALFPPLQEVPLPQNGARILAVRSWRE